MNIVHNFSRPWTRPNNFKLHPRSTTCALILAYIYGFYHYSAWDHPFLTGTKASFVWNTTMFLIGQSTSQNKREDTFLRRAKERMILAVIKIDKLRVPKEESGSFDLSSLKSFCFFPLLIWSRCWKLLTKGYPLKLYWFQGRHRSHTSRVMNFLTNQRTWFSLSEGTLLDF